MYIGSGTVGSVTNIGHFYQVLTLIHIAFLLQNAHVEYILYIMGH